MRLVSESDESEGSRNAVCVSHEEKVGCLESGSG